MALVLGFPGGRGGVRLIFSRLLQRLLGPRSRRPRAVASPASYARDEDDETSPFMEGIPGSIVSDSTSGSHYARDSAYMRMYGANPLPFGPPEWPADQLFDVETAWPESAKGGLEMTTGTRHAARVPRARVPAQPEVVVVETVAGQTPMLHIPLTDGLLASFLALAVGVHADGTYGVAENPASIPTSSDSKGVGVHTVGTDGVTANRPLIPTSSGSESDSKGAPTQWMKVFRGLLLAHVFFALPLVVIFFPRYEKGAKNDLLLSLFDRKEVGIEKLVVLALFVAHASLGSLGVLLAHIADGQCMGFVGSLTLCIIISVVGFIDYIFFKALPPETTYIVLFLGHFIAMLLLICGLWAKFVGFSPCCCSKVDSRRRLPV